MPSKQQLQNDILNTQQMVTQAQNALNTAITNGNTGLTNLVTGLNTSVTNLATVADKIKIDTHDMQRYAITATLGDAMIGFGTSTASMVRAFIDGRHAEGGGEILKMTGSVVKLAFLGTEMVKLASKTAAAWLGPLGILIGDLLIACGAGLIDGLGKPQKTIAEQLRAELAEFGGQEHADRLQGVLDALERIEADFRKRPQGSLSWDEVNRIGRFTGPDEVIWQGMAEAWLGRETKTEVWPVVFEGYSIVAGRFMQNVILGLDKMKKFVQPQAQPNQPAPPPTPTPDLAYALAVIDTICDQHDDMLEKFKPQAARLGVRWFIGSNENLYRADNKGDQKIGFHDTAAKSISLGSDGERLWHLGGDKTIYTVKGDDWNKLGGAVEQFYAVQQPATGKTWIVTINGTRVKLRLWDEKLESWPKFEATEDTDRSLTGVSRVNRFVATGGGTVFLLDGTNSPYVLDASGTRSLPNPGSGLLGVTADDTHLYVFSKSKVWSRPLARLEDAETTWTEEAAPDAKDLGLRDGWAYSDVYAGDDGVLAAIIDQKMYLLVDAKWYPTDGNTARQVVTYPVRGWRQFMGLESIVADVKSARDAAENADAAA